MKRYEMIKSQNIFNELITKGKFNKNKYFVVYYEKNDTDKTNFGIAISKKYGTAVERNNIKRKVRSIIDNNRNLFQKGYNYIIMIRKDCKKRAFQDLNEKLVAVLKEKR